MTQMNITIKQKQTHKHREQICGCQGEEVGNGSIGSLGLANVSYYVKEIINKILLYITEFIQYL